MGASYGADTVSTTAPASRPDDLESLAFRKNTLDDFGSYDDPDATKDVAFVTDEYPELASVDH